LERFDLSRVDRVRSISGETYAVSEGGAQIDAARIIRANIPWTPSDQCRTSGCARELMPARYARLIRIPVRTSSPDSRAFGDMNSLQNKKG
jgi:hypothetical protein